MVARADGALVVASSTDGITALSRNEVELWARREFGVQDAWGIPGSNDVLVLLRQGGRDAESYLHQGIARVSEQGEFLWTQMLRIATRPILFPLRDEVGFAVNPDYCLFWDDASAEKCRLGLLVLRLSSGEFVECVEGDFGGYLTDPWDGYLTSHQVTVRGNVAYINGNLRLRIYDRESGVVTEHGYGTGVPREGLGYHFSNSGGLDTAYPFFRDDGTIVMRSFAGWHFFTSAGDLLYERIWLLEDAPQGVPFWGPPTVHHDRSVYQSTDAGLFRLTDIFPLVVGDSDTVLQPRPIEGAIMLQDGSVVSDSFSYLFATPQGRLDRWLWRIHFGDEPRDVIPMEDGQLVVFEGGNVWVLETVHGGLAHTPSPRGGFDNYHSGVAPEGPFPAEPEIERQWRWPEEVDGSGE